MSEEIRGGDVDVDHETTVEETNPGQFDVIVTADGKRMVVGTHQSREKADLAADLVARSAHRFEGAATTSPDAPTYDETAQN
jgi:hypothetical protein